MQLSRRLPFGLDADALTEAPLAADVIDLTSGNPSHAAFALPEVDLGRSGRRYDAHAQGPAAARAALSAKLTSWGRTTPPEQLFLTASTSEALSFLIKAVCNAGDVIVTQQPGYPLVAHLAELEGVHTEPVPTHFFCGRWQLDLGALARALGQGARMVVLVTPNNPTGARLDDDTLAAVAQLCRKHDALCVLDEVFAPFGAEPPHTQLARLDDFAAVASLGGLSKAGLWPELKLSWIALAGDREHRAPLLSALEWIADAYLSVNQPVAHALPELLALVDERQREVHRRTARNSRALVCALGPQVLPREAGWYCIVRLGERSDVVRAAARAGLTPAALLEQRARVAVLPGGLFDLAWPDAVVLSLLAPPALFDAALVRLAQALAALPRRSAGGYSAAEGRP